MQETSTQNESTVRTELSRTGEELEGFMRGLQAIDRELEEIEGERQQYGLLSEICRGLDELEELGAGGLFWGEAAGLQAEEQLRLARSHADRFEKRIREIETRRQLVVDDVERVQQQAECLEDDLYDLERAADERKREWLIERDVASFPVLQVVMPWTRGGEDDQRFHKTLAAALLLCLLFGVIFPLINLPLPDPFSVAEIPDRLTQLIREEQPPPPPPKPQTRPDEIEQKLAKESTPEAKPKKAPDPAPASKGILAFREKFSSLAEGKTSARLGSQARIRNPGQAAAGRPQRSLVTANGPGASGGIDIGKLSRNVGSGGDGIEGVEIARVTSGIDAIGVGSDRPLSDGPGLSRTDEEIQIVFDRHKAALYRLYNRALRKDPTLKGQMVLRITIEPDGSVSVCTVQSSDMKAPQLSTQVAGRVKGFDFGTKDGISAITILYPIDFLPAT